jgi:hypothetical protein
MQFSNAIFQCCFQAPFCNAFSNTVFKDTFTKCILTKRILMNHILYKTYTHSAHTHKTYTHATYTVTKCILYRMYTGTEHILPDFLSGACGKERKIRRSRERKSGNICIRFCIVFVKCQYKLGEYTFCVYIFCEYTFREYTIHECTFREYTFCEYTFCKLTYLNNVFQSCFHMQFSIHLSNIVTTT